MFGFKQHGFVHGCFDYARTLLFFPWPVVSVVILRHWRVTASFPMRVTFPPMRQRMAIIERVSPII